MTNKTLPEPTIDAMANEYPPERSMAGTNAYYHHCEIYNGRSNYAVCLHTIDAVQENRVQLRSECPNAINNKTCPAMAMRAAEKEAGRSLYFVDRAIERERREAEWAKSERTYRLGKNRSAEPLKTTQASPEALRKFEEQTKNQAPRKVEKQLDAASISTNLLGDAIQKMMEEHKSE